MADIKGERCVLCLDEKRSPISVRCGHSFCCECLKVYKSYHNHAWANKCPICRSYLKENKRVVKQKFTSTNANTANPNAITTANPSNTATSSASLADSQSESTDEVYILEEFMALAAADSTEFTASQENLTQNEPTFTVDSRDDDDGDIDDMEDYEESDYEDYDNDNEVDFYTDSEEEIFYLFNEDDYDDYEISSNNHTSTAAYDFGDDTNAAVTEYNDISDSQLDNNEIENSSSISTVDSNNNSNSSIIYSSMISQDMDFDVANLEDAVNTD